ncbi:putative DUF3716 domain protein [Rosellinia necatrix]|uniref:Putative DUF3716 domain protein n=1 Tax=Rosellinia necatrix TaxID=77044 RepID=A0A1W2TKM0_ROSNE|nr:putative DUF3716 domain protein [Rosellinia necatrix]
MSSNTGPMGHQDWPAMEADYWQNTKKARDREDARIAREHTLRQDQLEQNIAELFERRAQLQDTMKDIDANIEFRKAEKHRLANEYEGRRTMLQNQRQEEDRSQQGWFARARENTLPAIPDKENAMPKNNSGASNRDRILPNPAGAASAAAAAAAASWTSINGPPLRRSSRFQEQRQEKRSDPGDLFGSVFHNPVDEDAVPNPRGLPLRNTPAHPQPSPPTSIRAVVNNTIEHHADRLIKPKQERHSLPSFPIDVLNESPEGSRKSSRGRKSLPSARDPVSKTGSPAAESTGMDIPDIPEITREVLVLRDNGSVLTHPPMFAGVPLEKIDENHPFWNPEWDPLEMTVQNALDKWRERLETLRQDPNAVRHTMFLANRQVNRGQAVLDFLKDGCFHPLQFANREMMDRYYKTFINYDTVFRLVNVHEELKKFDLGVAPLEWLRQRLYEISVEQGDKFSLSKTTHDLYHDEKLKALREKHGFGNIGRPSGYKVNDKGGNAKGTPKLKPKKETSPSSLAGEPSTARRRGRRSISQVDGEDDEMLLPRLAAAATAAAAATTTGGKGGDFLEPVTPRLQKRPRLEAPVRVKQEDDHAIHHHHHHYQQQQQQQQHPHPHPCPHSEPEAAAAADDLDYDGYSSRDSFSNGRIEPLDFRVAQIRTRLLATRPDVTQYWTWRPEAGRLEHRVLRDVQPSVSWGYYREPDRLNCGVGEIAEVRYASGCQKILVARDGGGGGGGGDMLVLFKRERTKRRFLVFAGKKGVKLVKSPVLPNVICEDGLYVRIKIESRLGMS